MLPHSCTEYLSGIHDATSNHHILVQLVYDNDSSEAIPVFQIQGVKFNRLSNLSDNKISGGTYDGSRKETTVDKQENRMMHKSEPREKLKQSENLAKIANGDKQKDNGTDIVIHTRQMSGIYTIIRSK